MTSPLPPSPTLTQLRGLDELAKFRERHGYAPSVRDLCRLLFYRSTNATADLLDALEAKGCIERDERVARSARLTELGERFLEGYRLRAVSPECADEFTTTQSQEQNP